jgi:tRNA A-37 threonylcarbamoyl transferase component Bud32
MTTIEKHPPTGLLSDYALGRLDAKHLEAVAEHVEQCRDCQETLSHLRLDDTLLDGLAGQVPEDAFAREPECAAALAEIRRVGPGSQDAGEGRVETRTPDSASADDMSEVETLRDYRLIAPLGHGGMGTVYRAKHVRLDRMVALKVLPAERMRQPLAVERFHREMKAIGKLDHPNIVRAYDAGEVDGKHFLAMELIDGVDLATLAGREGPLPAADACELVRHAAAGLEYAHRHGLVHRDVKPSNLMLDRQGVVKVLDLGLARLLAEAADEEIENQDAKPQAAGASDQFQPIGSELTGADQAMGTPDYMAPEQCSDSRAVDGRSDVYSLGATLYRLLAGRAPYSGVRYDTLAKKIAGLKNDLAPTIGMHRRDLPAGLAALVDRMLAKRPDDRPATPGAVAEALAPYCRGHRVELLVGGAEAPGKDAKPQAAGGGRKPSWRWLALSGGGAVAALALMLLARITTPDGELVVEVAPEIRDKVTIEVKRGDDVRVFSHDPEQSGDDWSISLEEGQWQVRLKNVDEQFKLDRDAVQITRGPRQLVRVTRRAARPRPGTWQLNLPAGFQRAATLTSLGDDDRFRLQTGGVLSGVYRWTGQRLVVEDPDDSRYTGLAWAWEGAVLVLVEEPPSRPAGPSYVKARLTFFSSDASEEMQSRIVPISPPGKPRRHLGETETTRLAELLLRNPANGHYYMRGAEPMSWHAARTWCESRGGHLATITSAEENEFVYLRLAQDQACWLGGFREDSNAWRWVTGEPFEFDNWYHGFGGRSSFDVRQISTTVDRYATIGSRVAEFGGVNYPFGRFWNGFNAQGKYGAVTFVLPLCEWEAEDVPGEIARRAGTADPIQPGRKRVARFNPDNDVTIAVDGVSRVHREGQAMWEFRTNQTRSFPLFEIGRAQVDQCILSFQASMKTEGVAERAYLEMMCRLPEGEASSKGFHHAVQGTNGWANYSTPFFLQAGQRPELIRLNLVIEGKGTVWIRDIEVFAMPLPGQAEASDDSPQDDGRLR